MWRESVCQYSCGGNLYANIHVKDRKGEMGVCCCSVSLCTVPQWFIKVNHDKGILKPWSRHYTKSKEQPLSQQKIRARALRNAQSTRLQRNRGVGSDGKESAQRRRLGFKGSGDPLQCSSLRNPMDRETCWATVHGITKSWTRLSD